MRKFLLLSTTAGIFQQTCCRFLSQSLNQDTYLSYAMECKAMVEVSTMKLKHIGGMVNIFTLAFVHVDVEAKKTCVHFLNFQRPMIMITNP